MGQMSEIRVDVLSKIMQNRMDAQIGKNSIRMSARAMDLNRDNKISVDEYSASILLKDALSRGDKFAKKNTMNLKNNFLRVLSKLTVRIPLELGF